MDRLSILKFWEWRWGPSPYNKKYVISSILPCIYLCLHLMMGNMSDSSLNSHHSARCGTYWGRKGSKKKVWGDGSRKFQSAVGIERNKNSVSTLVFISFFSSNGCWILHVCVCVCVFTLWCYFLSTYQSLGIVLCAQQLSVTVTGIVCVLTELVIVRLIVLCGQFIGIFGR